MGVVTLATFIVLLLSVSRLFKFQMGAFRFVRKFNCSRSWLANASQTALLLNWFRLQMVVFSALLYFKTLSPFAVQQKIINQNSRMQ